MTLRTWTTLKTRPLYAYQSLALAARHEWQLKPRIVTTIADARRESWHSQAISAEGTLASLQRVPATELPAGELLTPENFRAWSALPKPVAISSYDLAKLLPIVASANLFRQTAAPDAFQHGAPDYKKWSARPHSAETAKVR